MSIRPAFKDYQPDFSKAPKAGDYDASTSELLLEEICESFGSYLQAAYVNPDKRTQLVRRANPTILQPPSGQPYLLQFQYSRLSPLNLDRSFEVYKQNRKRKISLDTFYKEIRAEHTPWDSFSEVTDLHYIQNLPIHRWPKKIYAAIYETTSLEEKLEPFLIHEPFEIKGKLPTIHMALTIEPFFSIHERREDTSHLYDQLTIMFPALRHQHHQSIESALRVYPLDNLKSPEDALKRSVVYPGEHLQIHSSVPREITMGFMQGYLKQFLQKRSF